MSSENTLQNHTNMVRNFLQWQLGFKWGFPGGTIVNNPPADVGDARDAGLIPGQGDPLEEGMATHSSVLAWRIPWTEEPGGLQFILSQRVRHDWATEYAQALKELRYEC